MTHKLKLMTASALALCGISSAWAAAGDLTTVVTAVPAAVSYNDSSDPTIVTSSIVFEIKVTNGSSNTINFVRVTGTTSWPATYRFSSTEDCTAATNADGTVTVDCYLGKFVGGAARTFYVTFVAPSSGPDVFLSGQTAYAEGGNGNNPAPNSVIPFGEIMVDVGAATSSFVSSAVPADLPNQKFRTGSNTVDASLSDQIKTTVDVRDAPTLYNTLSVSESPATSSADTDVACKAQGNFNRCYLSAIDLLKVAGGEYQTPAGQFLYFTFRMEPAAVKKGFQARNVRVYHNGDYSSPVPNCSVVSATGVTPVVYDKLPCVDFANIVYYKKATATAPEGAVDIPVISNKNGLWAVR